MVAFFIDTGKLIPSAIASYRSFWFGEKSLIKTKESHGLLLQGDKHPVQ